jgi:hypothetical protein
LAAPDAEADVFFVPEGCFRFRVDDAVAFAVEKVDVPGILSLEADWELVPLTVVCPLRVVIPGPLSLSTSGEPLAVF